MTKAKSFRGEVVDFDMLAIKKTIKNAPKPINVEQREQFVDSKLKRRIKKGMRDLQIKKQSEQDLEIQEQPTIPVETVVEEQLEIVEEPKPEEIKADAESSSDTESKSRKTRKTRKPQPTDT